MKKAIIVEYSFMTRVVIDEEDENLETIVSKTKQNILDKVNNELGENLNEWYDDEEMPYDPEKETKNLFDVSNSLDLDKLGAKLDKVLEKETPEQIEDNIVIVLDTSNYKTSFAEETPFKGKVIDKYDINIVVKSLQTGKEYELYFPQILEWFDIEEIKNLLDMSKYGKQLCDCSVKGSFYEEIVHRCKKCGKIM
jgi:hypothetical protein